MKFNVCITLTAYLISEAWSIIPTRVIILVNKLVTGAFMAHNTFLYFIKLQVSKVDNISSLVSILNNA